MKSTLELCSSASPASASWNTTQVGAIFAGIAVRLPISAQSAVTYGDALLCKIRRGNLRRSSPCELLARSITITGMSQVVSSLATSSIFYPTFRPPQ